MGPRLFSRGNTQLPDLRDYALWGFDGSGVEEMWKDFDEYFQYYRLARADINARHHEYQEHEMYDRFYHIAELSFPDMPRAGMEKVAQRLNGNYWVNYKAMCYVKEDVASTLPELADAYKLGVVSNFMVRGGIEELLEINGVRRYFDFVVTSIAEGWRKPHPSIYRTALDKFGVMQEETVFVGDDYVNDYVTPTGLGMKPIYLDRCGKHPEIDRRVENFYQLEEILI